MSDPTVANEHAALQALAEAEGFNAQKIMDMYGITARQLLFAEYYLQTLNQRHAALKAGYSATNVGRYARINLQHEGVKRYINDRFADIVMSTDEILGRISALARADLGDYLRIDRVFGPVIDVKPAIIDGNTAALRKFSMRKGDTTIEIHNPLEALKLLGEYYRLFSAQPLVPPATPVADQLTDDQLAEILLRTQNNTAE